jgi:hypothetical protein
MIDFELIFVYSGWYVLKIFFPLFFHIDIQLFQNDFLHKIALTFVKIQLFI